MLAHDAQAKLALIVAQILSICPSICLRQLERSIARREPHRLPACVPIGYIHSAHHIIHKFLAFYCNVSVHQLVGLKALLGHGLV